MKATPERTTVKQVAFCKNCGEPVEKTTDSAEWYHSYTGDRDCYVMKYFGYGAAAFD